MLIIQQRKAFGLFQKINDSLKINQYVHMQHMKRMLLLLPIKKYHSERAEEKFLLKQMMDLHHGIIILLIYEEKQVQVLAKVDKNVLLTAIFHQACTMQLFHKDQIPGPGRYVQTSSSKNKGYSMRPKTANHRNYFIDDHEKQSVPSPFQYEVYTNKQGKTMNSKFKTAALGGAGLMTKESRFKQSLQKTPSVWAYKPKKYGINKKTKGGQIGTKARTSFIDDVSYTAFTPGPGNYKLPTDFGHYKKMSLSVLH